MQTALVIGGRGFLGKHLVDNLLDAEPAINKIRVFDLSPCQQQEQEQQQSTAENRVEHVQGSIEDVDALVAAMRSIDVVFHCASPPYDLLDSELFYRVNVDGTRNVIKACQQAEVKGLVLTSSCSVVYNGQDLRNAREDSTPFPKNFMDYYTQTKMLQERLVLAAHQPTQLRTIAIRPHGIFGPGDHTVSQMLRQASLGKMKAVLGNGANIVDFTYVRNVTHGHVLAAQRLLQSGTGEGEREGEDVGGQAFHITNDEPVPFWVFTGQILSKFGYPAPTRHIPAWFVMSIAYLLQFIAMIISPVVQWKPFLTPFKIALASTDHYYNCDKAKRLLGYQPVITLKQGIDMTCDYFRAKKKDNN